MIITRLKDNETVDILAGNENETLIVTDLEECNCKNTITQGRMDPRVARKC